MKKISVIIMIMQLVAATSAYASESEPSVKNFIRLLTSKKIPTLNQYYKYYGAGAESELELLLKICEEKGWTPPLDNSQCILFIQGRDSQREKTPSLYFKWLRSTIGSKLPINSRIEIERIVRKTKEDSIDYDLIYARMGDHTLVFFKVVNPQNVSQFGALSLNEFDGKPLSDMFNDYVLKVGIRRQ